MSKPRKRAAAAMVAALALAASAIPAALPAAAAGTVNDPVGQLVLQTGAVDQVAYDGAVQSLSTTGTCDLTSAGANLLQFQGYLGSTPKKVGFRDDSIGVIESSLTSLCNKVDTISFTSTETLELKLGSDLKNFAGTPLLATGASLDVEVRSTYGSKAKIQATAQLAGATVGTFQLDQGSAECNVASNGNCQWVIAGDGLEFDTLLLKAVKGSFSLEGGSDAGTSPTTFDLVSKVDAVFDCDTANSLTEGNATVTYVGNADNSVCEGFGVVLSAGDTQVQFKKPLDLDPEAQFIFDINWTLPAPESPAATLPTAKVDFEIGTGETDMGFCPEFLYSDGVLTGISNPDDLALLTDFEPTLDGTQFACIDGVGGRQAEVTGTSVNIVDKIFLIGDVRMRL